MHHEHTMLFIYIFIITRIEIFFACVNACGASSSLKSSSEFFLSRILLFLFIRVVYFTRDGSDCDDYDDDDYSC